MPFFLPPLPSFLRSFTALPKDLKCLAAMVQNESFKIKTARVTYVFFESVTLNKYSKISVPTPTISVFQSLPRFPTSSPPPQY